MVSSAADPPTSKSARSNDQLLDVMTAPQELAALTARLRSDAAPVHPPRTWRTSTRSGSPGLEPRPVERSIVCLAQPPRVVHQHSRRDTLVTGPRSHLGDLERARRPTRELRKDTHVRPDRVEHLAEAVAELNVVVCRGLGTISLVVMAITWRPRSSYRTTSVFSRPLPLVVVVSATLAPPSCRARASPSMMRRSWPPEPGLTPESTTSRMFTCHAPIPWIRAKASGEVLHSLFLGPVGTPAGLTTGFPGPVGDRASLKE